MNNKKYRIILLLLFVLLTVNVGAAQPNVRGTIKSTDGSPIPGVVVSDGMQCVQTAADGSFSMSSDLFLRNFVYFSLPDGYEIPSRDGCARFYEKIDHFAENCEVNFVLEPRKESALRHTIFMVGDPQIKQVGSNGSAEAYANIVVPSLARKAKSIDGPLYCIYLGDLLHNDMTVYDFFIDSHAKTGVPSFSLIGNHDFVQTAVRDTLSDAYYEMNFGPVNYSFNMGNVHYIFLKDIIFDRADVAERYKLGLTDETLAWMEADLSYVDSDKVIMLCAHAPMYRKTSSYSTSNRNYARYSELLKRFKKVHSWGGHIHEQFNYNYLPSDNLMDGLESHALTRVTGALYINSAINGDGSPQGYSVVEVNGDDVSWYFQPCSRDEPWEYKAYSPERTGDGTVVVNVWNYDAEWKVEWAEQPGQFVQMEQFTGHDYDFRELVANLKANNPKANYEVSNTPHLFRITPSAGIKKGAVRITDRFGRVYEETLIWQ